MFKPFAEAKGLTAALKEKRGTIVGVACRKGRFAVTETRGNKTVTLTGFQSFAECIAHMRAMLELDR